LEAGRGYPLHKEAFMPSTTTPDQNQIPPTHQDFRWIHGAAQNERLADFVELARDISAGVHTCLQIIHSSNLVREINLDDELPQLSAPAIGTSDAQTLFRLSLVATALLRDTADERIALLNALS
jgi:hypothetical protein